MNIRKINRILHRDFGYFFFGVTVIYALSGIALNHINDWNPSYVVKQESFQIPVHPKSHYSKENVVELLETKGMASEYKKHYFPREQQLKIFIEGGSWTVNLTTGQVFTEILKRRLVFYEVNWLHYNPNVWWTAFADLYGGSLILIAVTGLFVLRGKKGITGRGAWLTGAGILIPILFLIFS